MGHQKALFLDRDGVINIDYGYVYRIDDFHFIEGIFDISREAVKLGFLIIVVTNQSGIGRGYFTEEDYRSLMSWMIARFEDNDIPIAGIYHCADPPKSDITHGNITKSRRKPSPSMLFEARDEHQLELERSVIIGDKDSDIEAAYRANVSTRIRFLDRYPIEPDNKATHIIHNLRDAKHFFSEE